MKIKKNLSNSPTKSYISNFVFKVTIDDIKALGETRSKILYLFSELILHEGLVINEFFWIPITLNTLKEFFPGKSKRTLQRYITSLEDDHLLVSEYLGGNLDRTKYYRINSESVSALLGGSKNER